MSKPSHNYDLLCFSQLLTVTVGITMFNQSQVHRYQCLHQNSSANSFIKYFQCSGCPNYAASTQPNFANHYRATVGYFNLNLLLWVGQGQGLTLTIINIQTKLFGNNKAEVCCLLPEVTLFQSLCCQWSNIPMIAASTTS